MGYVNKLSCQCGYKKHLNLGSGRQIPDVAYIREQFSVEMLTEFNAALNNGSLGTLFYIENTLSYCKTCNDIKEGKALHFQVGTKEKIVFDVCTTCGESLTLLNEELICPNCGNILEETTEGLWD